MKQVKSKKEVKSKGGRGFLSMTPARRTEIARLGGKAISKDPSYMSYLGKISIAVRKGLSKRKLAELRRSR